MQFEGPTSSYVVGVAINTAANNNDDDDGDENENMNINEPSDEKLCIAQKTPTAQFVHQQREQQPQAAAAAAAALFVRELKLSFFVN